MSNSATAPGELSFEVMVTLEDQLALQMRCLATPAMKAGWLQGAALRVLLAIVFGPVAVAAGTILGWAEDRHGISLGSVFGDLVFDQPGLLVASVLVMAGITIGSMVLRRSLVRPRIRRVLRRMLRAQPGVDPSDPQLAFRARVIVSDEGLESRSGTGVLLVRWDVLKRWEETAARIMVLGDAMVGFCLPTVRLDPGVLERLRAGLTARLGPQQR